MPCENYHYITYGGMEKILDKKRHVTIWHEKNIQIVISQKRCSGKCRENKTHHDNTCQKLGSSKKKMSHYDGLLTQSHTYYCKRQNMTYNVYPFQKKLKNELAKIILFECI